MHLGSIDKKAEAKAARKEELKEKEENRKRKYEQIKKEEEEEAKGSWARLEEFCGEGVDAKEEVDSAYEPPSSRTRKRTIPPLRVPANILSRPRVVESMTRRKITPNALIDIFSSIVVESGGNLDEYFLSSNNLHTRKSQVAREMAVDEKKSWKPPVHCVLMWDEKKIERNGEEEIRMPVLVAGDERPPTLIGSVKLENGKAPTITEGVVSQADGD